MKEGSLNRISKIRVAECSLKLPFTLRLGSTEITTRDYVLLRVETESGVYGEALGYPRGTPLYDVLVNASRAVMGQDANMRQQVMNWLEFRNVPGRGALTRGLSLLEIALTDIACKLAGQPLYRYLGGLKSEARVTAVAGYYMDRRSIDEIADEVSGLVDSGYDRVKIMLKGDDLEFDRRYAAAVCDRAPGRVAADAHWSFATLTEAARLCTSLDGMGLAFLEDPFSAADVRLTHELQTMLTTPIAAGEDVFGPSVFQDLVSGIGLLRVDATTCGGVAGAQQAIAIAAGAGRTVFPHAFAPLHVHFACAFANVEGAEWIPENSGADPLGSLLRKVPEVHNGGISPSEEPGAGIQIDWPRAEQYTKRVVDMTPES